MSRLNIKVGIFSLFLFLIGCSGSQQTLDKQEPSAAKKMTELEQLFSNSDTFTKNFTGFMLRNPETDSTYFQLNADKYFTPASNTKLFTFYAALKLLPDSLPALDYVVKGDSLIFWGTGDPTLLHPDFEQSDVISFLNESPYKLYYSDNHYEDRFLGPGWAWGDYQYSYSAEKTPFPIYGNTVKLEFEEIRQVKISETKNGELGIYPKVFRDRVEEVQERPGKKAPLIYRDFNDNALEYKPESDTVKWTADRPFHYDPYLITELLSDTLSKEVSYLDMVKPQNTKRLYSIPKDTVLERMLKPSDNFIAEQMLLAIASEHSLPMNSRAVIEKVKEKYLQDLPDDAVWVDGSGLSRYNLFTPRSMVKLLEKIDEEFVKDSTLFSYLPAGGRSGTIENWYEHRKGGVPYVFAKTGTLSNNHCLTGYVVTKQGTKLLFTFMNNHYTTSSTEVKTEMEKVLWYIYNNY